MARQAARIAPPLLVLISIGFAVTYGLGALQRIAYPYDVEFVEDGMLMQAMRVAAGRPVFLPPSAEFAPHVYMPLYTWLGGLLVRWAGLGYAPLRLLSFAATLATATVLYAVGRRESGQPWVGVACAGLFVAGYSITGGWYDLARVDALFLAFSLAGAAVAVYCRASPSGLIGSGLLLGFAFLTKQNGLFVALAAAVHLAFAARWRVGLFVAAFVVAGILPVGLTQTATDGWFGYYAFGIAYASPIETARLAQTLRSEWLGSMAPLSISFVLAGWLVLRRGASGWPWLLFAATAALISLAGRSSVGGNLNNLMPGYAFLCLMPSLLVRQFARSIRARLLIVAAIFVQFSLCVYNPVRYLPTEDMRAAGDSLIARIAAIDGDVLVMMHPLYAVLAGKSPSAQIAAMWHARWRGRDPLPPDFVQRIEQRAYAAIISDESEFFEFDPALAKLLEANYERSTRLTERDAPPTLTGLVVRPKMIWTPRRSSAGD